MKHGKKNLRKDHKHNLDEKTEDKIPHGKPKPKEGKYKHMKYWLENDDDDMDDIRLTKDQEE